MSDEERKYEIRRLERQMEMGSISVGDVIDGSLFDIISEAIELYKEKYNIA